MEGAGYVYLDLETGGLDPHCNTLLQIGAVVDEAAVLIQVDPASQPDMTTTPQALAVNGLSGEPGDGVPILQAMMQFAAFLEAAPYDTLIPVGWRIHFDHHWLATLGSCVLADGPLPKVAWHYQQDLAATHDAIYGVGGMSLEAAFMHVKGHVASAVIAEYERDHGVLVPHRALDDAFMCQILHRYAQDAAAAAALRTK